MINCRFISPGDGWAIIEENNNWFVFHPPYHNVQKKPIDLLAVSTNIDNGSYVASDLSFDDYQSLVSHLNNVVGAFRAEHSPLDSEKALASKALKIADSEQILRLLNKLDRELHDAQSIDDMEAFVFEVLELDISRANLSISQLGIDLLKRIGHIRTNNQRQITTPADMGKFFPYLKEKYGAETLVKLTSTFSMRRSMFAI